MWKKKKKLFWSTYLSWIEIRVFEEIVIDKIGEEQEEIKKK